jgi:DnaK suppressor protein
VATAAKKPVSKPAVSGVSKPVAKKPAAPGKMSTAPKAAAKQQAPVKSKPPTAKALPPVVVASSRSESERPIKTMKTAETKTAAKPAAKAGSAKPAKATKKVATMPLNDAELLAMPESDYMNEAQLAYFKAKLTAMRDEILENARETGVHLKENEVFADPNDRATVEEENLLEQRVRDRERKLLKKINSSLARIEAGEYGYCQETGDPIGLPRLLARPTAELSIEAQEKHERLEKLYAD